MIVYGIQRDYRYTIVPFLQGAGAELEPIVRVVPYDILLPRTNLPRAKRLLRATDRVKYAEVPPDERFFAELEDDLRGFIDATKPVSMSEARRP